MSRDRHHELPARPSVEYYRKQAKELHRGFEAGDTDAVERAREVLGSRAAERFVLSDAQFVLAQEHGFGSWAGFRADVESRTEADRPVARIGPLERSGYDELASALLSDLRAGSPDAFRRLRAYVPRLADAVDPQEAELRDARLVIAGEFGFPTWRDLLVYTERFKRGNAALREDWQRLAPYVMALRVGDTDRLRSVDGRQADRLLHLLTQPKALGRIVGEDLWLGRELGVPRVGVHVLAERATDLDTPLNLAACFNRVAYVQLLLEAGASVSSTEIWGITPLMTAIYHGSVESADLLADHEIVPRALWVFAGCGRLDLVQGCFDSQGQLLPEAVGQRPNLSDVGFPPRLPPTDDPAEILGEAFVHACQNGRLEVVRWFLNHGVDPNVTPYYGQTPLHWAIGAGHVEVVRLLLERGADPSLRDRRFDGDADGWAHHALNAQPDNLQRQEIHDLIESHARSQR